MILLSFKHRGLERFYTEGCKAGINANHAHKLNSILGILEHAETIDDIYGITSLKCHLLKGNLKDHYSVKVSGSWCVTFKVTADNEVEIINYQQYH